MLRQNKNKISYEIWFGRKDTIKYFKLFGSKCYIMRIENNIGKFDDRSNEGIFIGHSSKSNACRCYNRRLGKIVESVDVKVDGGIDFPTNNQVYYRCLKMSYYLLNNLF